MSPNRLFELIEEAAHVMNLVRYVHLRRTARRLSGRCSTTRRSWPRRLPGTKTLTLAGPDRFEGTMKVSIGPLTAAEFAVVVTLTDETAAVALRDADRRQRRRRVCARRRPRSIWPKEPDGGTVMTYASDVQIGGRIAAVGPADARSSPPVA